MNLQTRTIAVIGRGYVGLPLGAGEEEVTDRQRHPSWRGPSGPVAINCELPRYNEPLLSFASQCFMDRHARLRLARGDGIQQLAKSEKSNFPLLSG
jgi:hypothetical protein